MSVLVDKNSKIIVQGFTGKEGTFHSSQMIEYEYLLFEVLVEKQELVELLFDYQSS